MSTDLRVILDDNSAAFSYSWSGGNTTSPWDLASWPYWWYGGTTQFPRSSASQIGSFTFTFNGTSAAFTGHTPPSALPQTATVQIDNGASFVINYQDPSPQNYMQWFTTPTLPDGKHTITMTNLYTIAIDYAVIKVGNQTSLNGQTVIVDDDSSLIQYSGQWSRSTNKFFPVNLQSGRPYGNLTHRTSNPGDTFAFRFSGTSFAVYGIFSWNNLGSLTTTYTLNETTYSSRVSVTTSSPGYLNKDGEVSNYLHFGLDSLPSGTHTLLVNITEANNQPFILDYITYKPSFDRLSSMPSLSPSVSGTTTASHTIAFPTSASHTSSATSSIGISGGSRQSVSTGAIIGGVLGGVAFGVLVTILVLLLIRRWRKAQEQSYYASSYEGATLGSSVIDPNHPHTANSFQMQERSPTLQSRPGNSPAKYGHRHCASSISANDGTVSPTRESGVEEALANPPSYDAISNRVQSSQP